MMDSTLFLIIFAGFGLLYFLIGLYASRSIKTTTDYFLAGRGLGITHVAFTLIATQLGGGMLLGITQKAYHVGYFGILYALGMAIGFVLLGAGFAAKLQAFKVSTTAELFEKYYGSPGLKKLASIISVATMCGLLVGQVVASRTLLLGLGIQNEFVFAAFWAFVILYTMVGGLYAVVLTDAVQVMLIILVFVGLFIASLLWGPISLTNFLHLRTQQTLLFSDVGELSLVSLTPVFIMPALFSLIEQDLAQRFFASRTARVAVVASLLSAVFMILFACVPIYFGMAAKLTGVTLVPGASPLVPVLQELCSPFVFILAICAVMAAMTSTADSLLCAISSHLAQDFAGSFGPIRDHLWVSKVVTLVAGFLCFACAYIVRKEIVDVLVDSYEISISALFVSIFCCFFKKKFVYRAAVFSMVAGLVTFILFKIFVGGVLDGLTALGVSALAYVVGEWTGKPVKQPAVS